MYLCMGNERMECTRAEKGRDYIRLYDAAGTCIASFGGISSFAGYAVDGGAWSDPPKTEIELLREELQAQLDAHTVAVLEGGGHA